MSTLFLHSVYYYYGMFAGLVIVILAFIINEIIKLYKQYRRIRKWRRDRFN